jgi:Fe-S cluster biosynthesis and repair protein YggX
MANDEHLARIERFKTMTQADPDNELGHFSLARSYIDIGMFAEAVPELQRVITLNRNFSKAYALLGQAQHQMGQKEFAIETLTQGYRIAQERGDLMPRNEMGALLKELGGMIPETKQAELTPELAAAGNIKCRRCAKVAPKMAERPFSGPLGEKIHASVCASCFREWIGQGTKVINELRLNLTDPAGEQVYDQHMKEFLNLD